MYCPWLYIGRGKRGRIMKRFLKREYLLIAFGVILFVVLNHVTGIFNFAKYIFAVLLPVIAGFLIAFILNVPMKGFENLITLIFKRAKHKPGPRLKRMTSLILTLAALIGVCVLGFSLVIPMLIESVQGIYSTFSNNLPEISEMLEDKFGLDTTELENWVREHSNITELAKTYAITALKSVFSVAVTAVSGIFTAFMVLFVAIYALLAKDNLAKQTKRICAVLFKEKTRNRLYYAANLLNYKYYKYLSGQFIEACILGVLVFTVLAIFSVPNAFIIAFMTAILAFVPYVGAFSAFGIGALLTLISAPEKIIAYIIIVFVVQIIETQLIAPHVVGNAVGLSALWTLVAVFIGGNLFGLIGMILFIPLFSVFVTLLQEYLAKREGEKVAADGDPDPADPGTADEPPKEGEDHS